MKILFQGDSVTDGGRDRSNFHDMGEGYPKYASAMIRDSYPKCDFEFVNLGISGNRTKDLVARLESDFIEIQPDIVSIMIGVNDVWHHYDFIREETTDDEFERNMRTILDAIKTRTSAKILMLQPLLLDVEDKRHMREELERKQAIFKRLADEYAVAYVPTDDLLRAETDEAPTYYAADGVHPTDDGACYIAERYLAAISPMIESLIADGE